MTLQPLCNNFSYPSKFAIPPAFHLHQDPSTALHYIHSPYPLPGTHHSSPNHLHICPATPQPNPSLPLLPFSTPTRTPLARHPGPSLHNFLSSPPQRKKNTYHHHKRQHPDCLPPHVATQSSEEPVFACLGAALGKEIVAAEGRVGKRSSREGGGEGRRYKSGINGAQAGRELVAHVEQGGCNGEGNEGYYYEGVEDECYQEAKEGVVSGCVGGP